MRLGQIARKLNVKPLEVKAFIEKKFEIELGDDLNLKLEDEYVDAINEQFKVIEVVSEAEEKPKKKVEEVIVAEEKEETTDDQEPKSELKEIVEENIVIEDSEKEISDSDTVAAEQEQSTSTLEEVTSTENKEEEEETDVVDDMATEPIELEVDPNAELIKAPKVTLEGLKVVGKIDLPEDKKEEEIIDEETSEDILEVVSTEEIESNEIDPEIAELDAAMASSSQDINKETKVAIAIEEKEHLNEEEEEEYSVYKDKRGIYHFSQEQKQNRIDSLHRLKTQEKIKMQKAAKQRFYKETVSSQPVKKKKTKKSVAVDKPKEEKKEVKGVWGKFLRWLND